MSFSGEVIAVDPVSIENGKNAMMAAGNQFEQLGADLLKKYQGAAASWTGMLAQTAQVHIQALDKNLNALQRTLNALAMAADQYAQAAFQQDLAIAQQIG